MSTQLADELRRTSAALEEAKAVRSDVENDLTVSRAEATALRAEADGLRQQVVHFQRENETFRQQTTSRVAIAQEIADLSRVVRNFHDSMAVEMTNKVASIITPYIQNTRREVDDVRLHLQAVGAEFTRTLEEFEAKAREQGEAITANYIAKVNAGWKVVSDKYAEAESRLKGTQAVSASALKNQTEALQRLSAELEKCHEGINGMNLHIAQWNARTGQAGDKFYAAAKKLDMLTNGTLTEVAGTARRTIDETSDVARQQIKNVAKRPVTAIMGIIIATALLSNIASALGGRWLAARHTNQMIAAAVETSTETVLQKLEPALERANRQAADIRTNTESLNRMHEYAQLWVALISSAKGNEGWTLQTRAVNYAKAKGFHLPLTLAQRAAAMQLDRPISSSSDVSPTPRRGKRRR